jgi:hypothetical protein
LNISGIKQILAFLDMNARRQNSVLRQLCYNACGSGWPSHIDWVTPRVKGRHEFHNVQGLDIALRCSIRSCDHALCDAKLQ